MTDGQTDRQITGKLVSAIDTIHTEDIDTEALALDFYKFVKLSIANYHLSSIIRVCFTEFFWFAETLLKTLGINDRQAYRLLLFE